MHTKPVIYDFPIHLRMDEAVTSRYLPWFREDIILAFDFGRWLNTYIAKNLSSIDEAAHWQGKIFYYHPRDGTAAQLCVDFYAKGASVYHDYIHHYFFDDQYGPTVAFLRRLDASRFLAWLTEDIVKQDGQIHWPDNLFDDLADISYKSTIVEELTVNTDLQMTKDRVNIRLSDPNVSFGDFEKHVYCCGTCQSEEVIYIEKGYDFYNIMETEYPCGRCGKESAVVSSGDLIYRWNGDEWHPEVASIPLAAGHCLDCKPYFESKVEELIVDCSSCGQPIKVIVSNNTTNYESI